MGDVTGPISTLPGTGHSVPAGAACDCHPERPAVARMQGETDSFGCEMIDMCAECVAEERAYRASPEAKAERCGKCDWCKKDATDLRDTRDYDEGMYGPVYRVCDVCDDKQEKQIREELERYNAFYDAHDYEPHED